MTTISGREGRAERTERQAGQAHRAETDPRWAAVRDRDATADGRFYYAVETTGVYCRPSCGARRPRPEHVRYFATQDDAGRAGFRPCKRCRPDQPSLADAHLRAVTAACRAIEGALDGSLDGSGAVPRLEQLAAAAGFSPSYFHRVFKRTTGLTPRAYAMAHRAARVRAALERSDSVTRALYEAGFNASSRFYETSNEVLGMTPTRYRDGGGDTEIRFAIGESSLGSILVAESDRGICAIALGDDPEALLRELQDRFTRATLVGGDEAFERRVAQVIGFIEAPEIGLDLPLDVRGTAFQRRVWQALRDIPAGTTLNYAQVAERIGAPTSVRAVAQACGANRLAVAIPCHRVVRSDGGLSGYRWGVDRKRALLAKERAATRRLQEVEATSVARG